MTGARLPRVSTRDRMIGLLLVAGALAAWLGVAWLVTNVSPVDEAELQLLGAAAIGLAVALTACPILWLLAARRDRDGTRRPLAAAARRAGLIGLVVVVLIDLRLLGILELPLVAFVVAMAVVIELAFSVRR
jgi:hypothetical protein